MRLKKIKLAGFKSFVEPTTIPFPGDMTAIVGPNGCGKSNVIDAIRWVLGESSAKNLRGDAMTDVIFNGSTSRKAVAQCSVELVFDNSQGRIGGEYAGYNELSVKRLVTRDAQSHYFLNASKCRRRDITDLFLGTGLGPRSYAIIEQGMISRLIESKPQELRTFIEEAAGISRYKERRKETETRIKHTQDNLERLNDVRAELGTQIAKLEKQAAAAQRYKTLKKDERRLKSELAVIRWLHINQHADNKQAELNLQQQELDNLKTQQQGDAADLTQYQVKADALKQAKEDNQQRLFSVTTQITRLEQDTLHGQQRRNQINTEMQQLESKIHVLQASQQEVQTFLNEAEELVAQLEPEFEMAEQAKYMLEQQQDDAKEKLDSYNQRVREQEKSYYERKQTVQSCHSQLQVIVERQLRTNEQISELNDELSLFDDVDLKLKIESLEQRVEQQQARQEQYQIEWQRIDDACTTLEQTIQQHKQQKLALEKSLSQLCGQIAALETLQANAAEAHAMPEYVTPVWQQLRVKPGYDKLVDSVLKRLGQPWLISQENINQQYRLDSSAQNRLQVVKQLMPLPNTVTYWANETQTTEPDCLAMVVEQGVCPSAFKHIILVNDLAEAYTRLNSLAPQQSCLTIDGIWLGHDWIVDVCAEQSDEGVLARANALLDLQQRRDELEGQIDELTNYIATQEDECRELQKERTNAQRSQVEASQQLSELHTQLKIEQSQQDNQRERHARISQKLASLHESVATDDAQIDEMNLALEENEAALLELEERVLDVEHQREVLNREVEHHRQQLLSSQQTVHGLQLKLQQQRSQYQMFTDQLQRNQQQLQDYQHSYQRLHDELKQLDEPKALQHEQLQLLLDEQQTLEEVKQNLEHELDEVTQFILDAQSGQQQVTTRIEERQRQIEALKVDIEGTRVRAAALLEQLADIGTTVKQTMETLPTTYDEQSWQQQLETTSAALKRLGAVNLAAVEEFAQQAERKQHLDTQHNDLAQALETLEDAIKKINRETRQRFSTTFEQVNDDLKMLFPKVFGGGAAYLALTDDDMLETGVTIMARPPGKKNSTIHLLSGGEKALTALSLVFAIFRLNPAPFCLLDEVDAPLDDANVGRFCNLVSEMSKTVQFIYITHNKIAMEMATHLTGVTMAEPGVSRMVAVDVEEAMAFVETN